MGAFASEAAGLNVGNFGSFVTSRNFILDESAFGLARVSWNDEGRCRTGGNAGWDLDVESLAAGHAAGDVLKLVDFVLGQLGRRKDDREFRALSRA